MSVFSPFSSLNSRRQTRPTLAALSIMGLVTVAGCSSVASEKEEGQQTTVSNCHHEVTVDSPPQRVMTMGAESITTLAHLGQLDRVMSRAGVYPSEYFDAQTMEQINQIPALTDRVNATGHLQISVEEVLAQNPDLVLGATETANYQTLHPRGVPVIDEPAYCDGIEGPTTWDDVWDQVNLYGTVFAAQDRAKEYVEELKTRVGQVKKQAEGQGKTVAVVYPELGGGVLYAYGSRSMSNPMVEAAGLSNVFGSTDDRVFEVNPEEVVSRNPDVIIALYTSGSADDVVRDVTERSGFGDVAAVKGGHVMPMLLNFAEPATPLSVDGVEKIDAYLRDHR